MKISLHMHIELHKELILPHHNERTFIQIIEQQLIPALKEGKEEITLEDGKHPIGMCRIVKN